MDFLVDFLLFDDFDLFFDFLADEFLAEVLVLQRLLLHRLRNELLRRQQRR